MPRIAILFVAFGLQACALSSAPHAIQVRVPGAEQIARVEVACMSSHALPPQSTVTSLGSPEAIAHIQAGLAEVATGWQSWGITTLPGPELRVSLIATSGEATLFFSGSTLKLLWNAEGSRALNEAEQHRLREALPSC